jgi:hypothetical protein
MPIIADRDRTMIFNTINLNSSRFTEREVERIHEMALELDQIRKSIIDREDNPRS